MPGNFDDKDLRGDAIVPPQPPSVRTITCYEVRPLPLTACCQCAVDSPVVLSQTLRFRVGMVQRAFHEEVILDPSYEYSTVLKNDTELRCVSLPRLLVSPHSLTRLLACSET